MDKKHGVLCALKTNLKLLIYQLKALIAFDLLIKSIDKLDVFGHNVYLFVTNVLENIKYLFSKIFR